MLNRKALESKKREEEFKKLEENRKRFEKDHSICHKTMTNGRETQKEKIWQRKQIPLPNGLPFGTNELFLNNLSTQTEQKDHLNYLLNATRQIVCHCSGFPLALSITLMGGLNARKETGLKGNVSLHSFYKISWIDVFEIFFLHVKTLCIIVYYSLICFM